MSIRSTLGNITHNAEDFISNIFNGARTALENIVGNVSTSLSNIWSGGFVGMSESGIDELCSQIENYCQSIEAQIAQFDEKGNIENALKGDVQVAAADFIAAVKQLLQAYVSTMRQEIAESHEAYTNFVNSGKSIAQDVESAASDIRSNADSIKLD